MSMPERKTRNEQAELFVYFACAQIVEIIVYRNAPSLIPPFYPSSFPFLTYSFLTRFLFPSLSSIFLSFLPNLNFSTPSPPYHPSAMQPNFSYPLSFLTFLLTYPFSLVLCIFQNFQSQYPQTTRRYFGEKRLSFNDMLHLKLFVIACNIPSQSSACSLTLY
jgi:hypothetical protein